jgi:hypothetical protein
MKTLVLKSHIGSCFMLKTMLGTGIYVGNWNTWLGTKIDIVLFFSLLYSSKTHPGEVDNLLWTPSSSQKFTVKSYYTLLLSSEHSSFPWRSVWKVKALPRVAFFLWTTTLDRILTMDTLRKRGFSLANWCCLFKKNEEMTNHLLSSTASILRLFGNWSLIFLESHGLCLTTSKNLFFAGKHKGWDIPKRLFEKLFLPF